MADTVSLSKLPDALRIKSRNEFITGALREWRDGKGLAASGLSGDITKAQVDEAIAQFREFYAKHFDSATVKTLPEVREEWAS